MAAPAGSAIAPHPNASTYAAAVTPSDSTVLPATQRLYVGGAGNLAVVMQGDGGTVTILGVTAGSLIPIAVTKVMSTNTTATNITALW